MMVELVVHTFVKANSVERAVKKLIGFFDNSDEEIQYSTIIDPKDDGILDENAVMEL